MRIKSKFLYLKDMPTDFVFSAIRLCFITSAPIFYAPECEGGVLWSDPGMAIDWPLESPIVSEKDAKFSCLEDIAEVRLPD